MESLDIDQLISNRREGYSLAQAFYTHPDVFKRDMERIFHKEWLLAGAGRQIPKHGDYMTFDVAGDSIIITRGKDMEVRAFHNTCRHRGSRICLEARGHATNLSCPYHRWVYDLEGKLVRARLMEEDFDKNAHSLKPVHVRMLCDLIYICLAQTPLILRAPKTPLNPR